MLKSAPTLTVILLGMLAALPPLATDLYLPGFPLLARDFATSDGNIQASLSIFFLGLSLGQAFYGPLVDRYGRKLPLLIGIGLYCAATLGCLLTPDIEWFIGLRFVQAVGGCAGMIIGRVIVSDLFDQRESARALSLLMMVMTLAPIVAPILGGLILGLGSWHLLFGLMLAFGLICALLVALLLPETLARENRSPGSLDSAARGYSRLLRHRAFMVPTLVGGLAQGCMFAFITGSPVVFMGRFGVDSQTYGWLFACIAGGLIVAAQANRVWLERWSAASLLTAALIFNGLCGLVLLSLSSHGSLPVFLAPLWGAIASLGLIGANSTAIAMEQCGQDRGSGSALVGVLQFGCAFLASSLVAAGENGTAWPMTLSIAACGLLAGLLWWKGKTA